MHEFHGTGRRTETTKTETTKTEGIHMSFFEDYEKHVAERAEQGIPPLALTEAQAEEVVALLQNIPAGKGADLLALLTDRVNPGVDPAAHVKADFLVGITKGAISCDVISKADAVKLLGTMVGGYNLQGLIDLIKVEDAELAPLAADALKHIVLSVNCFDDVNALATGGNAFAKEVITSWANAEWFTKTDDVPSEIKTVIYKVDGEINTDDFSPAKFAFTRADIPLHSTCMGGALFPEGPAKIAELEKRIL